LVVKDLKAKNEIVGGKDETGSKSSEAVQTNGVVVAQKGTKARERLWKGHLVVGNH